MVARWTLVKIAAVAWLVVVAANLAVNDPLLAAVGIPTVAIVLALIFALAMP